MLTANSFAPMKILILASNPRKDLNLDREIRDLRDVIEKSRNHQQFEVEDALAVRVGDLQDLLFKHEPQIVHFCGHGGGQPGLVFEGNDGQEQWVRTEALRDLFRLFSKKVGCVLLNACYSESQANEIVNHVDYVIGMNQEIRDDAAIAFSKGFYRALGYDCSVEEAYEFGCNAIQLEITGSSIVRSATADSIRKAEVVTAVTTTIIPEHLKPTLKKKQGISGENRWQQDVNKSLAPVTKEALQLEIAQDLIGSSAAHAAIDRSQMAPGYASNLQSSQNSLNASPRRPLTKLLVGGLMACLISAGGLYGYQQWTQNQQQTALQQAIELAKQEQWEAAIVTLNQLPPDSATATHSQGYLEAWSTQLLKQSETNYQKGDLNAALKGVQTIPRTTSVYPQAQAAIVNWTKEKQTFENIKQALDAQWDVTSSRELLQEIKSPGLRQQVEAMIAETEKKIQTTSPSAPPVVTQPEPKHPDPEPSPKPTESPSPEPEPKPTDSPVTPSPEVPDYQYSWLAEREVTSADLAGKSDFELLMMRSSIFARYGLIFERPELQSEFAKQSWYKPTTRNKQAVYNAVTTLEWKNLEKIDKFRASAGKK